MYKRQRTFGVNQQYLASYKRTFAQKHNFDVLVGFENYSLKMQYLSGSNTDLYNPNVGELDNTKMCIRDRRTAVIVVDRTVKTVPQAEIDTQVDLVVALPRKIAVTRAGLRNADLAVGFPDRPERCV